MRTRGRDSARSLLDASGRSPAPFNRYRTVDVLRAIIDSGRRDIALYTGNDDSIVVDLLSTLHVDGGSLQMVGGLLGHWSVWTLRAVEL